MARHITTEENAKERNTYIHILRGFEPEVSIFDRFKTALDHI
jgi:hypothetical protein